MIAKRAHSLPQLLLLLGAVACSGAEPSEEAVSASGGAPAGGTAGGGSGSAGASFAGAGVGGTSGASGAGTAGVGGATGGVAGGGQSGTTGGAGVAGSLGAGTSGAGAAGAGAAGESGSSGTSGAGGVAAGGAGGAGTSGASGAGSSAGGTAGSMGGGGLGAGGAGGSSGTAGSSGSAGAAGSGSALCPPGITQTITVAKSGGQFSTVQAAIDSISSGSSTHIRIDIRAGTYREKITIASRSNLCLVGENVMLTVLTYDDDNAKVGSTSGTASVYVSADDFSAANLTIENSFGSGSQAVALRTNGDRQQFLGCRFVGYQDTLYTHHGLQYFRDCYVQGNTDYVFGGATAILQNCEVRNVEGGSAVAAPNTDVSLPYGIVFLGGNFTAVSSVKANSVALGRPWGADGAGAYLNVNLGTHIASAGFVPMSSNDPANARFREYQSTGPGANASAHSGYQMSSSEAGNYTIQKVLGGWTPSYSQ